VADPVGLRRCCLDHPDQCADRYVAEVVEGVGAVTVLPRVDPAASWSDPLSFGLRIADNPYRRGSCGGWVDEVPRDPSGRYFLATSRPAPTADQALSRARHQVKRSADGAAVRSVGTSPSLGAFEASASGMRTQIAVEERDWCVEQTDRGYVGRVLGFVPRR
jgi:hypothetical protein